MIKKDETAFKRFLMNHGVNVMFTGLYNQFKYEDNPETVKEFLEQVPRNLAIAYAFDVTKLSAGIYGAKYWNDLDQKWRNFINKTDERKSFEEPQIDRDEKTVRREEKAAAAATTTAPASTVVENDWAGLDLVGINAKAQRSMPMPDENEVRVNTKNKSVIVLNSTLVQLLGEADLDSMSIQVDRQTNRMVLVFGKGMQFNVTKYSNDVKAIQYKAVIEYLEKYLSISFDPEKYYYIRIAQRMWNKSHTQYAVIMSQRFQTKDR